MIFAVLIINYFFQISAVKTAQKTKFPIKDILQKKSLMKNFIFCAVKELLSSSESNKKTGHCNCK